MSDSGALVAGSGTWSRPLGSGCTAQPGLFSDDWCSHTAGNVIVLNLAALPLPSGTTNLLADLNANVQVGHFLVHLQKDRFQVDKIGEELLEVAEVVIQRIGQGMRIGTFAEAAFERVGGVVASLK